MCIINTFRITHKKYDKSIAFLQDLLALKRADLFCSPRKGRNLSTLSTDAAGELDVLGHDGDTLGVDGAQVGVLEETDEVSL